MLDALRQDVRYTLRQLRRSKGFAAVAVLSLALGIGANTAIFSLIDAVMLKSVPVSHPEELLQVTMATPQFFSNPMWEAIRDRQDVLADVMAYGRWGMDLSAGGEVRLANGAFVSGRYFDTLGVRAVVGRVLSASDDWRGCPGAAVLTYGFWERQYGGRSDAVGRNISLDGHSISIVGVTERGFEGIDIGARLDVLVPLCTERILHAETSGLDKNGIPGTPGFIWAWLRIIGRAKPGGSAEQATARLKMLAPEVFRATLPGGWEEAEREKYLRRTLEAHAIPNGLSYFREQYRLPLLILMAVVSMVLLIACANVANLLLARGAVRQREMAVRLAMGAGRGRLMRQLLTESLLLSATGATLGVFFAKWSTRLLIVHLDVPLDLRPDVRVLAFTASVAILTGLLFGIAPAWRAARVAPQAAMKANARGTSEGRRFGMGKALAGGQMALSLLLVAGAGLLLSTFWRLASLDTGFNRDGVLLVDVDLRPGHYPADRRQEAYREMRDRMRAIPGVRVVAQSDNPPLCGCGAVWELEIEGYRARSREDATVTTRTVSAGFFQAMGIPILAGRDFGEHDTPASPAVAVINQALAERYFAGESPVGRHFRIDRAGRLSEPVEIVGVVGNAKYGSLREELQPTVFAPWGQDTTPYPQTAFELRTAGGDPTALITAVKAAVAEVNRHVSLQFTTLADKADRSISRERLLAALSGFFGALALLLAGIGLYGVMSYNVARRRNEMGIRMALGAEPGGLLRMVLGEVAAVAVCGLAVGIALALASTRLIASLLYGVPPNDPRTLALAAAVLAGVAAAAGYVPARRASRMDPMAALREE